MEGQGTPGLERLYHGFLLLTPARNPQSRRPRYTAPELYDAETVLGKEI